MLSARKISLIYNDLVLYSKLLQEFGITTTFLCKRLPLFCLSLIKKMGFLPEENIFQINSASLQNPILMRWQTSDSKVFLQIFVEKEYSCLDDLQNVNLIVDCGANVGYSAVYFLNKFPSSYVIAVEPDPHNAEVLRKNLLPYTERVSILQTGIWSQKTGLVLKKGSYCDGRDWAIQVAECLDNETPDLMAVDLSDILNNSGYEEIDLLKVDIERAEAVVFSENYEYWLEKTKNIAIELHDKKCEEIFFKALSGYDYELMRSGELTICRNLSRKKMC